jgi:hypothetical protein
MLVCDWLKPVWNVLPRLTRQRLGRPGSFRPYLEPLEGRLVPADITVRSGLGPPATFPATGAGLAAAIAAADRSTVALVMLPPATYSLSAPLAITSAVSVLGSDPRHTIITGNLMDTVLSVNAPGQNVLLAGLTITGGAAVGGGGGILDNATSLFLFNDRVTGNTDDGIGPLSGAGISVQGTSPATIFVEQTTIDQNTEQAGDGGGILVSNPLATVQIVNSTISGNQAPMGNGGGIAVDLGSLSLTYVTIADNTALQGGGLSNGSPAGISSLELTNTILADNTPGNFAGVPLTSKGHNIDSDGTAALNGPGDQTVDPQLGPLTNNGGLTPTQAVQTSSPAAGRADTSVTFLGFPVTTDQRGARRPAGNSDIGAFQIGPLSNSSPSSPSSSPASRHSSGQ